MSHAPEVHDGKVSTGGHRAITNLRFADYIDAPADEVQELDALAGSLDKNYSISILSHNLGRSSGHHR